MVVIRQAHGSTGQVALETVSSATDPFVEQSLEDRAVSKRPGPCRQRRGIGARKPGRSRRQADVVNGARERDGDTAGAAGGGKASKGRCAPRGCSATGRNGVNPRVGSVLQHTRRVSEEEAVEVVQNHEDGTWSGGGRPFPKSTTTWSAGVDSEVRCLDGRAIFEDRSRKVWWGRPGTVGRTCRGYRRRHDEARSRLARSSEVQEGCGCRFV